MHIQSFLPARMAIGAGSVTLALLLATCMSPTARAEVLEEFRPQVLAKAERALEQGNPDRALALMHSQRAILKDHRFRAQRETLTCAAYFMKGSREEAEQACELAAEWGNRGEMWADFSNRGALRLMPGEFPVLVQE